MVFNRLCDPGSKLGVLRWLETVALPLDFGFADGPPQHQHLLRAMDVIDEHSDALGVRLVHLLLLVGRGSHWEAEAAACLHRCAAECAGAGLAVMV